VGTKEFDRFGRFRTKACKPGVHLKRWSGFPKRCQSRMALYLSGEGLKVGTDPTKYKGLCFDLHDANDGHYPPPSWSEPKSHVLCLFGMI